MLENKVNSDNTVNIKRPYWGRAYVPIVADYYRFAERNCPKCGRVFVIDRKSGQTAQLPAGDLGGQIHPLWLDFGDNQEIIGEQRWNDTREITEKELQDDILKYDGPLLKEIN